MTCRSVFEMSVNTTDRELQNGSRITQSDNRFNTKINGKRTLANAAALQCSQTCNPALAERETALAFAFESFPALPPGYKSKRWKSEQNTRDKATINGKKHPQMLFKLSDDVLQVRLLIFSRKNTADWVDEICDDSPSLLCKNLSMLWHANNDNWESAKTIRVFWMQTNQSEKCDELDWPIIFKCFPRQRPYLATIVLFARACQFT